MLNDYSDKILIVGNGPSVNETKLGKVIDSFGTVVRLNCFYLNQPRVNPECTGIKTDIWATKRLYPSDVNFSKLKEIIFFLINHRHTKKERDKIVVSCKRHNIKMSDFPSSLLEVDNKRMRDFVEANQKEVLKYTKGSGKVVPSTGLNAISYFLQKVPYVYVHGFDLMKAGLIHYWDTDVWDNWTHVSKANVYPAEKWAFDNLLKKGEVKILCNENH